MSNEFDIERAEAGDSIEYQTESGDWVAAHFVGTSLCGYPVIQTNDLKIFSCEESVIRMSSMSSKVIKVRYRVAVLVGSKGTAWTEIASNPESEAELLAHPCFVKWADYRQEIEILHRERSD